MRFSLFLGFVLAVIAASARADVTVASLFADGMVLQRDIAHPVWGWADPGERVDVRFRDQQYTTRAGKDGRWQVTLAPLGASAEPAVLVLKGKNRLELRDILVGDVWLCSGQSNMEWAVSTALNPQPEAAAANFPQIRHCKITRTVGETPAATVEATWATCSPATVLRFSAVGYFFARDQHRTLGVPIGIVTSAWGGTQVESWISADALAADPDFAVVQTRWQQRLAAFPAEDLKQQAAIATWEKEAAAAKAAGKKFTQRKPAAAEGPGSRWLPTGLYNGMIHPLRPFPFRGVLWYQGEANEFRAAEYGKLFQTMIRQWRTDWQREDWPFYFVQLANYATPNDPSGQTWAFLREAQAAALALPQTGMIVTVDIGEDRNIHFKNKQEAGRRLSLIARAQLQHEALEFSGPLYLSAKVEGAAIRVSFSHARGLRFRDGRAAGFEIAGADQKFHPAHTELDGETVLVRAEAVPAPVAVRYAWRNTPEVSLFNDAGLPAAPFRSDDWPASGESIAAKVFDSSPTIARRFR